MMEVPKRQTCVCGEGCDDDRPETCPQCGAVNSDEDGAPVCADAPDFCSVACQETYFVAEGECEP